MAEPKAFICGYPITHSRSPLIHNHWLKRLGIPGSYERAAVAPEDFGRFICSMRSGTYVGGNVTIPHKEAAFAAVDRHDEDAEAIGAANTLWFEDGRLIGGNTDAFGFAANLDEWAPGWDKASTCTVLGAGGAARAIVHALLQRGIRNVRIVNRTEERARHLADHFVSVPTSHGLAALPELMRDTQLLVNTTSLGMDGGETANFGLEALPAEAIVHDIVYVPLETPLLRDARARGLRVVDGLGMLLHQAVPGFQRWFGQRPHVDAELRALVVADVEKPA